MGTAKNHTNEICCHSEQTNSPTATASTSSVGESRNNCNHEGRKERKWTEVAELVTKHAENTKTAVCPVLPVTVVGFTSKIACLAAAGREFNLREKKNSDTRPTDRRNVLVTTITIESVRTKYNGNQCAKCVQLSVLVEIASLCGCHYLHTTMANEAAKPSFSLPPIEDNPNGWGPSGGSTKYVDLPFEPFSKGEMLGRVSDWNAPQYNRGASVSCDHFFCCVLN